MKKLTGASALHAQAGNDHVVALTALRVMLLEDSGGWFAQGLEVDYAASGATVDEAKKNFEDGFCATVREHLQMYGSIERFLKVADAAAWNEFFALPKSAVRQLFSCVQLHQLNTEIQGDLDNVQMPFDSIAFISKIAHESSALAAA